MTSAKGLQCSWWGV